MVSAPPRVYVAQGDAFLPEAEAYYAVEPDARLHLEIEAGSRLFQSEPYTVAQQKTTVTIMPRTAVVDAQQAGSAEVELEAKGAPAGHYPYESDFDDGERLVDKATNQTSSRVRHAYKGLKPGDSRRPNVRLLDDKGNLLAKDSITITVQELEEAEWDCGFPVDYAALTRNAYPEAVGYWNAAGQRHGPALLWYDTAETRRHSAGCYVDGKKQGRWFEWNEDGGLRTEVDYDQDQYHGWVIIYYANGQKSGEGQYEQDAQHGAHRWWRLNGQLAQERFYTGGEWTGIWRNRNEDGSCPSIYDHDRNLSIPCP